MNEETEAQNNQQPEGREFDHYKSVEAKKEARDKTENAMVELQEKTRVATEAHNKAHSEYLAARTESYDGKLVQKARDLGINPDNFADQETLEGAVDATEKLEASKPENSEDKTAE